MTDSRGIHGSIPADIREKVRQDVERLKRIVNKMEQEGAGYTVDEIVVEFKRHLSEYSLFNFMRRIILNFRSMVGYAVRKRIHRPSMISANSAVAKT